jgi:hypothetical protein
VDLDVVGSNPITRPSFLHRAGMADETEILDFLRANFARVHDRIETRLNEVFTRLGALERDFAGMKMDFAGMHLRLDNIFQSPRSRRTPARTDRGVKFAVVTADK